MSDGSLVHRPWWAKIAGWSKARRIGVGSLLGVAALVVGLAADFQSFIDRFVTHPLTPELASTLEDTVRQVKRSPRRTDDPASLESTFEVFAKTHHVSIDDVRKVGLETSRQMDLAEESLARGVSMARQHLYEQARREFSSATENDPGNPAGWSNLAAANTLLGRYDEARVAYDRALLLTPKDWRIRYNFGLLFARTGDTREAMKHLTQVLSFLRSAADKRKQLDEVVAELESDPALGGLRHAVGYAALVGR